jgi:hypothetical protein
MQAAQLLDELIAILQGPLESVNAAGAKMIDAVAEEGAKQAIKAEGAALPGEPPLSLPKSGEARRSLNRTISLRPKRSRRRSRPRRHASKLFATIYLRTDVNFGPNLFTSRSPGAYWTGRVNVA